MNIKLSRSVRFKGTMVQLSSILSPPRESLNTVPKKSSKWRLLEKIWLAISILKKSINYTRHERTRIFYSDGEFLNIVPNVSSERRTVKVTDDNAGFCLGVERRFLNNVPKKSSKWRLVKITLFTVFILKKSMRHERTRIFDPNGEFLNIVPEVSSEWRTAKFTDINADFCFSPSSFDLDGMGDLPKIPEPQKLPRIPSELETLQTFYPDGEFQDVVSSSFYANGEFQYVVSSSFSVQDSNNPLTNLSDGKKLETDSSFQSTLTPRGTVCNGGTDRAHGPNTVSITDSDYQKVHGEFSEGQLHGEFQVSLQVESNQSCTKSHPIKVQMQGIAASQVLDLISLKGYDELVDVLEEMFEIKGQLRPQNKLEILFTDDEGDMMLMEDDPWEEFVGMAREILIRPRAKKRRIRKDLVGLSYDVDSF